MGMVLSAVGACLLFILKAVGILLLIILVVSALDMLSGRLRLWVLEGKK